MKKVIVFALAFILIWLALGVDIRIDNVQGNFHYTINLGHGSLAGEGATGVPTGHDWGWPAWTGSLNLLLSLLLLLTLLAVTLSLARNHAWSEKTLDGMRRLHRSRGDKKLGGVCGGLAEVTHLPSWIWRAFFLLLLFGGGSGLILYVILWILMPDEPKESGRISD